MRVMVIVKADENSEAGVMPSQQLLTEMGKYKRRVGESGNYARRRRSAPDVERQASQV